MADYGEWNRKGAVLSDVTAQKEYGVTREFVVAGINAGKLEYREGSVWGNPYLRVLRSQLEPYIAAARKTGGSARRAARSSRPAGPSPQEVRAWARAEGIEVKDKGRVPAELIVRFQAAQ